eukprot:TRINITY_DN18286_c0_g1_i1.p1 TRINITY_DN18286_c0_g1~~TRINITY_DN18286_c0_g1_i1.p1  ORF type:complete len:320 (+),score=70.22 TRINITY_DN18286_c0_g1_i1:38-997(+)
MKRDPRTRLSNPNLEPQQKHQKQMEDTRVKLKKDDEEAEHQRKTAERQKQSITEDFLLRTSVKKDSAKEALFPGFEVNLISFEVPLKSIELELATLNANLEKIVRKMYTLEGRSEKELNEDIASLSDESTRQEFITYALTHKLRKSSIEFRIEENLTGDVNHVKANGEQVKKKEIHKIFPKEKKIIFDEDRVIFHFLDGFRFHDPIEFSVWFMKNGEEKLLIADCLSIEDIDPRNFTRHEQDTIPNFYKSDPKTDYFYKSNKKHSILVEHDDNRRRSDKIRVDNKKILTFEGRMISDYSSLSRPRIDERIPVKLLSSAS